MNLCFFMGKIMSDINFKFIINKRKNISIATFEVKLNNKSKIKVIGYNEIADICYCKMKIYDDIYIYGLLNSNGEIEIKEIYFLNKL